VAHFPFPITLGAVARKYGVQVWQVRRLFERRILPEPARIGHYRVVRADELPAIEMALREAGYLPSAVGASHAN
jgi:transposase-like protein